MKSSSKFLPDSVSGAIRALLLRVWGAIVLAFGIWALLTLLFHNAYMDGFACAGTFGHQSFMGNIVGFLRYIIGWVPAAFLILCIMRCGVSWAMKWDAEYAPEYNLLRGFVAVCVASAAFGMIAPVATYGGLIGAITAVDVHALIGDWCVLIGMLCLGLFICMGGMLLHIKLAHIQSLLMAVLRSVRWVLSLFHLIPPAEEEVEEDEEEAEEEVEEETEDDADEKPKRKARTARKRAVVAREPGEYELPDPMFLLASNFGKNVVTPELRRQATMLETHFAEYGVYGKVENIKPGPIVTLYEFLPDAGLRISKISDTVKKIFDKSSTI